PEMVVLAELLLRGPQTLGELRGRASRMHAIESLEMATNIVQQVMDKPEPLVKQIAPAAGSRAERYVQLLCPELHEIGEAAAGVVAGGLDVRAARSRCELHRTWGKRRNATWKVSPVSRCPGCPSGSDGVRHRSRDAAGAALRRVPPTRRPGGGGGGDRAPEAC